MSKKKYLQFLNLILFIDYCLFIVKIVFKIMDYIDYFFKNLFAIWSCKNLYLIEFLSFIREIF